MGFIKKIWSDRKTEYPNRRRLTKENGSTELVTVSREEGNISEEGDAFSAENMNDLEERIAAAISKVITSYDDLMANTVSGYLVDALTVKEALNSNAAKYNEETDSLDVYVNGLVVGSLYCGFKSANNYLYKLGDEYTAKTGGIQTGSINISSSTSSVVKNTDSIALTAGYMGSAGCGQAIAYTAQPVEITNNKLSVAVTSAYAMGVFYATAEPIAKTSTDYTKMFAPTNGTLLSNTMISAAGTYTYDVSALKGKKVYIGVVVCGLGYTRTGKFSELYQHD